MSKTKEAFDEQMRVADQDGLHNYLKNLEYEYVEYEQYEEIIELSKTSMLDALTMYSKLDHMCKVYFAQKHIDYTKQPRQLYKLNLWIINQTF